MTLFISDTDYQSIRDNLGNGYEVGGRFVLNGNQLVPEITTNGSKDTIQIESRFPYIFHTHPGVCKSRFNCSLGVPSSQDMKQIIEAAAQGNIAHFVIAHEGLYVVQARCALLQQYGQDSGVSDKVKRTFKQRQLEFTLSGQEYYGFIQPWLKFANANGFSVLYYPLGSPLQFSLDPACTF
jgi:hypothetical protein